MNVALPNSPDTAALSPKGPHSLSMQRSEFRTSSQSFHSPSANADRVLQSDGEPEQADTRISLERDEGDNCNAFAVALDPGVAPTEDSTLFYSGKLLVSLQRLPSPGLAYTTAFLHLTKSGDKSSALDFLSDICHRSGSKGESHYLVPRASKKTKKLDDLSYLRSKGAFSAPSKDLCDELICSYFRHVHPLLPIVDSQSFLQQYLEYGYQNVNLLLLWSMFLAAANVSTKASAIKTFFLSPSSLLSLMSWKNLDIRLGRQ